MTKNYGYLDIFVYSVFDAVDTVLRRTDMDCKYCQDEICVNADCPMCADFCPVVDVPGVCRFEERGDGT